MIEVGQLFPEFSLPNQHGAMVSTSDLRGKPAVVFFYPKDDTPGCTAEACGFRDATLMLGDVRVLGISPDAVKSHAKFATKFDLNFDLLADAERQLINACGLWVEKTLYGRKYWGVDRTTFILDPAGRVTHVFQKVKPHGHEQEILAALNRV